MRVQLDDSIAEVPIEHLGDVVRAHYRAAFTSAVATGQARPLVLPYSLIGAFVVPTLWLAVPHRGRWWSRWGGWLVVAFVVAFDVDMLMNVSSTNMACAYATGLLAYWGIMSTLNVVVWREPQVNAARIVKRTDIGDGKDSDEGATKSHPNENGLGHRKREDKTVPNGSAESQYVWEPFPEKSTFRERLNWALDVNTNFRFIGWNWSISALPRPKLTDGSLPGEPLPNLPPDITSIPLLTQAGYRRDLTPSAFIRDRLLTALCMYLILDFLAVFMMKDPYFILGPDQVPQYPLPPYLAHTSPTFLAIYRQLFCLVGIVAAISGIFNVNDLVSYSLTSRLFPMRRELWMNPATFGSPRQILDRGLAGWWGGYWHQLFRVQFAAPARWLLRKGYVERGTITNSVVALLVSFVQSGLLHGFGSVTCIPRTKVWRAPLFFLLQVVGIVIQLGVSRATQRYLGPSIHGSKLLRRTGNVLFTMLWLHWTAPLFADDIAASGIWLLEPVPASLFRAMGFGHPGDHWWRWDRYHWPQWYSGPTWWQTGFII